MADIKENEKIFLENLFGMENGYVSNLPKTKFQIFIFETFQIDVLSDKYS